MRINKIIKDKIKIEYLFIQGVLDIDSNYFINEINKGIKEKENENFKTNVRGLMTSWRYFNNDNFLKVLAITHRSMTMGMNLIIFQELFI